MVSVQIIEDATQDLSFRLSNDTVKNGSPVNYRNNDYKESACTS